MRRHRVGSPVATLAFALATVCCTKADSIGTPPRSAYEQGRTPSASNSTDAMSLAAPRSSDGPAPGEPGSRTPSDRDYGCRAPQRTAWLYCLGAVRAGPRLAEELASYQQTGTPHPVDDIARAAGIFNVREAVAPLREMLRRPRPQAKNPTEPAHPFLLAVVASALADLEDREVVPDLEARLRENERVATVFQAGFDALVRLDPGAAARYARELLHRIDDTHSIWAQSMMRTALPVVEAGHATDVLPILVRWSDGQDKAENASLRGQIGRVRIRLGDAKLLATMRQWLSTEGTPVPAHPEHWVGALGKEPADVPVLVRFAGATPPEGTAAYDAIDDYVRAAQSAISNKTADAAALREGLAELRQGLNKLTSFRDDRAGAMFSPTLQVRHHAALTRLGSTTSGAKLLALTEAAVGHGPTWLAEAHALEIGLPGAADRMGRLAGSALSPEMPSEIWEARRAVLQKALVTLPSDPRWVAFVFDPHEEVRRHAIAALVRRKPAGACAVAATAVRAVATSTRGVYVGSPNDRAILEGFGALAAMGDACVSQWAALVTDRSVADFTRGAALGALAALRYKERGAIEARLHGDLAAQVARAGEIDALP